MLQRMVALVVVATRVCAMLLCASLASGCGAAVLGEQDAPKLYKKRLDVSEAHV